MYAIHKDEHCDQEYVLKINYKSDYKATTAHMQIENKIIRFQVDPVASVHIVPQELVPNIPVQPFTMKLRMWNDTTNIPVGKCRSWMIYSLSYQMRKYSPNLT